MNARERFQRRDVLPGEEDIAAAGMVLAEDQAEQRALAGTVRADQAMDFAGLEREVDRVGDVQAAEMLVEPCEVRAATSGVSVAAARSEPAKSNS